MSDIYSYAMTPRTRRLADLILGDGDMMSPGRTTRLRIGVLFLSPMIVGIIISDYFFPALPVGVGLTLSLSAILIGRIRERTRIEVDDEEILLKYKTILDSDTNNDTVIVDIERESDGEFRLSAYLEDFDTQPRHRWYIVFKGVPIIGSVFEEDQEEVSQMKRKLRRGLEMQPVDESYNSIKFESSKETAGEHFEELHEIASAAYGDNGYEFVRLRAVRCEKLRNKVKKKLAGEAGGFKEGRYD